MNTPLWKALEDAVRAAFEDEVLVGGVDYALALPEYEAHARRYAQWVAEGRQGSMHYLARGLERRMDPRLVFADVQSVLTVGVPYSAAPAGAEAGLGVRYARYLAAGDYHDTVARGLERALEQVRGECPELQAKVCVDTSAVLERTWGALTGLGWIGKNTLLIHPQHGSYFFVGVALLNRPLGRAPTLKANYCGSCTRCLEGCPTEAFTGPGHLDARRCIAYVNLEDRSAGPDPEVTAKSGAWVAGCDVCQEVCPFNTKASRGATEVRDAGPTTLHAWEPLLQEALQALEGGSAYQGRVKGTALSRVKPAMFRRNLAWTLSNALRSGALDPGSVSPQIAAILAHPALTPDERPAWAQCHSLSIN